MAGLYIHIPFCESRCIYCGFYSTTSLKMRDAYVDALCREMELRPIPKALGDGENIETIYLGGGTPSQLTGDQLIRLFDAIRLNYLQSGFPGNARKEEFSAQEGEETYLPEMEITMECNPDDVTEEFCETLKLLPVNRVSMGADLLRPSPPLSSSSPQCCRGEDCRRKASRHRHPQHQHRPDVRFPPRNPSRLAERHHSSHQSGRGAYFSLQSDV